MSVPRESLPISVAQVLRRAGVQHPFERTVTTDELTVAEATVPAGAPIEVDLVLEATGNAVIATGELRAVARCACRRCLETFDEPVVAAVREIFEPKPVEGETYPLVAEHIELLPLVRDSLLLSLPLAPLCRPDCPGPAPDSFPAQVDAATDEAGGIASGSQSEGAGASHDASPGSTPPRDPRWAALDQLKLDR